MVLWKGCQCWQLLEDRVGIDWETDCRRGGPDSGDIRSIRADKVLIFLQEPRKTTADFAYFAPQERFVDPELDKKHIATTGEKTRASLNQGSDEVNKQEKAMRVCLRSGWSFASMMCVTPIAMDDFNTVEGLIMREAASNVDYDRISKEVRTSGADHIVSYGDSITEPTYNFLDSLTTAADSGKGILHFEHQIPGRNRNRWDSEQLRWYDGRGDLAFLTNADDIAEQGKDWADGPGKFEPPCTLR